MPEPGSGVDRELRRAWRPVALFALFVAGYVGVHGYVRAMPVADEFASVRAEFELWTVLMGLVGGFALASAAYFGAWLARARRLSARVDARAIGLGAVVVLVVLGTLLLVLFSGSGALSPIDAALARQTRPVTILAGLCLTPGLVGFLMLRAIAVSDADWTGPDGANLRQVIRLREELRRLLGVLGAFLTLLVITAGVRRKALLAYDARLHLPPEAVLLYGATFAVLLGAFFVAASTAVDARAAWLLDDFAPLPDPRDPQSSDAIRRRSDLAGLLGLDASWRTIHQHGRRGRPSALGRAGRRDRQLNRLGGAIRR